MVTFSVRVVCAKCHHFSSNTFASNCGYWSTNVASIKCKHVECTITASTWTGWFFGMNADITCNFIGKCKKCNKSFPQYTFGAWGWPANHRSVRNNNCNCCDNLIVLEYFEPHAWWDGVGQIGSDFMPLSKLLPTGYKNKKTEITDKEKWEYNTSKQEKSQDKPEDELKNIDNIVQKAVDTALNPLETVIKEGVNAIKKITKQNAEKYQEMMDNGVSKEYILIEASQDRDALEPQ